MDIEVNVVSGEALENLLFGNTGALHTRVKPLVDAQEPSIRASQLNLHANLGHHNGSRWALRYFAG